jgi:hypothetical protein
VKDIESIRDELIGLWYSHLKQFGIRFPTSETRISQLACLYAHYPNAVSQSQMDNWIRKRGGENDRQARHLAWDGWYLQTGRSSSTRMEVNKKLNQDQLCLFSIKNPNPIWVRFHEEEKKIKQLYPHFHLVISKFSKRGCAMCGTKSSVMLPYSKIQSESNEFDIVPLCRECESWCNKREVTLEISRKLIARPLIKYGRNNEQHSLSKEKRNTSELTKYKTETLDLPEILDEILSLQPMFSSLNTPEMQRRGILIRKLAPSAILPWAEKHGLSTEGRDGTGRKTRVPWFRAHSKVHSPKATTGWYIVYLFTFDGSAVYLSLNQGTTDFIDKQFIPKSPEELASRVSWAKQALRIGNDSEQTRCIYDLDLRDKGTLANSYSLGNVVSFKYEVGKIPEADNLRRDFDLLVGFLNTLQENSGINSARFNSLMRNNTEGQEAKTKCGHTIKVTAVKRKGGPQEGQWSILVKGPRITGKSGRKTIYCKPSIYYVIRALSSFFGAHEIISPENGIEEILPR